MTTEETHLKKYRNFKKEGDKAQFVPSKIENYFLAAFHLIETVLATKNIHSNVHKRLFQVIKSHEDIFAGTAFSIANSFRRIERDLRPGVMYGASENGRVLKEVLHEFETIETLCFGILEGKRNE
ncbi:MAG: hypothetical protein ACE5R6_11795 [Candidatus Heimdallarchaeota archaeon]